MKVDICPREAEVVEQVTRGGWPQCAEAELREHAAGCPVCADVVEIATLLRDEHAVACREAELPSAGLVWWRAELRARQEAARVAARPMTLVQGVAAACAVAALLTLIGALVPWARAEMVAVVDAVRMGAFVSRTSPAGSSMVLMLFSPGGLPVLLALGAWLLLAPVALYFVFARE
jgi:hypothetical protein